MRYEIQLSCRHPIFDEDDNGNSRLSNLSMRYRRRQEHLESRDPAAVLNEVCALSFSKHAVYI